MKYWFYWVRSLLSLRGRIPARVICAMMTLAVWAHAATVFAQRRGKKEEAPPVTKSYILPYMLVVLCIALGLLVVCRSGGRSDEPKSDNPA